MTYSEQLKDPRWQRKRLEIMQRDDWKCRHCEATEKTLNVHHVNYEKFTAPWDYDEDNLVTLYEDCHSQLENVAYWVRQQLALPPKGSTRWVMGRTEARLVKLAYRTVWQLQHEGHGDELYDKLKDLAHDLLPNMTEITIKPNL